MLTRWLWLGAVILVACSSTSRLQVDAGLTDAGAMCTGRVPQNHVSAPASCPTTRPPSPLDDAGLPPRSGECNSDADCLDGGQNGRCAVTLGLNHACSYDQCFTNADCAGTDAGSYCACRDGRNLGGNQCVVGDCAQDSDCGPCGYCSPTQGGCSGHTGVDGYYCHTPKDECLDDSDCGQYPGTICQRSPIMGYWVCSPLSCAG